MSRHRTATFVLIAVTFAVTATVAHAQLPSPDDTIKSLNNSAVNALNAGQLSLAIDKLESALKLDPTCKVARQNLAVAYNNLGMRSKATPSEAIKHLHKASSYDRNNEKIQRNLDSMIRALNMDPASFADRVRLGDDAKLASDLTGATVEYNAALKIKEDPQIRVKLGEIVRLQLHLPPPTKWAQNPTSSTRRTVARQLEDSGQPRQQAPVSRKKQIYVVNKDYVFDRWPRAVSTEQLLKKFETSLQTIIDQGNTFIAECRAAGVSEADILQNQRDVQEEVDVLNQTVSKKAAAEGQLLQDIIKLAAHAEVVSRGLPKGKLLWTTQYKGKDAIDLTDGVLSRVTATP